MTGIRDAARLTLHYAAVAALGLLGGGTTACGYGCDLSTCSSGLRVLVQPAPSSAYRVELLIPGFGTRHVWRCEGVGPCPTAFFPDYLQSRAEVDVIVGTDTTKRVFTNVRYEKYQPNGAKCDPTCHIAELTVPLGP